MSARPVGGSRRARRGRRENELSRVRRQLAGEPRLERKTVHFELEATEKASFAEEQALLAATSNGKVTHPTSVKVPPG